MSILQRLSLYLQQTSFVTSDEKKFTHCNEMIDSLISTNRYVQYVILRAAWHTVTFTLSKYSCGRWRLDLSLVCKDWFRYARDHFTLQLEIIVWNGVKTGQDTTFNQPSSSSSSSSSFKIHKHYSLLKSPTISKLLFHESLIIIRLESQNNNNNQNNQNINNNQEEEDDDYFTIDYEKLRVGMPSTLTTTTTTTTLNHQNVNEMMDTLGCQRLKLSFNKPKIRSDPTSTTTTNLYYDDNDDYSKYESLQKLKVIGNVKTIEYKESYQFSRDGGLEQLTITDFSDDLESTQLYFQPIQDKFTNLKSLVYPPHNSPPIDLERIGPNLTELSGYIEPEKQFTFQNYNIISRGGGGGGGGGLSNNIMTSPNELTIVNEFSCHFYDTYFQFIQQCIDTTRLCVIWTHYINTLGRIESLVPFIQQLSYVRHFEISFPTVKYSSFQSGMEMILSSISENKNIESFLVKHVYKEYEPRCHPHEYESHMKDFLDARINTLFPSPSFHIWTRWVKKECFSRSQSIDQVDSFYCIKEIYGVKKKE
ncbi:hypothetical protein DFA_04939 [Cavenderia fasciculata]|uniref:Uncharacterized protein n=1 Tax=Cavenderia fasciculata TaxID=261658 RepID=F4PMF9_CACFS|nr:uncharacterized protein DFA_04939 [Cavenderia fasciculata]EGG22809.1 hypothetical protein DFA_04939 [Cavenderia fasciculata]|eukprot:XP_004360660.1 hypothetical protein DFA_04939 [Cavenderia fasciculata]